MNFRQKQVGKFLGTLCILQNWHPSVGRHNEYQWKLGCKQAHHMMR